MASTVVGEPMEVQAVWPWVKVVQAEDLEVGDDIAGRIDRERIDAVRRELRSTLYKEAFCQIAC